MSRAPALEWFVLCCLGSWLGTTFLPTAPVGLLTALAAIFGLSGFWVQRVHKWNRTTQLTRMLLGISLALCTMAVSVQRYQEFVRWESGLIRGSVEMVVGPITEIRPYAGDRVSIGVGIDPVGDASKGWRLRLIAEPDHLLEALHRSPVDDRGYLKLPARIYPFLRAGNPGEFDRRMWALSRGYVATGYLEIPSTDEYPFRTPVDLCAYWPDLAEQLGPALRTDDRWAWHWRCTLLARNDPTVGAVSIAMALGQRDAVSPQWQDKFSRSGLAHLLSVSGLHVGFLLLIVTPAAFLVSRVQGGLQFARWALPLVFVVAFVRLVGSPASALRAGVMAVASLVAGSLGRPTSGWQMIGLAGVLLLSYNPHYVYDLGFQLSFLATAAIIAVATPLWTIRQRCVRHYGWIGRFGSGVMTGLGISAAAQAVTAPLVATSFSYLSWVSPLTNVFASPLGAGVLLFHIVGLMVGEFITPLAEPLLLLGRWCVRLLLWLADIGSRWGAVEVPMFTPVMTAGWYLACVGGLALMRGMIRAGNARLVLWGRRLILVGLSCLLMVWIQPTIKSLRGEVDVWVLDVGQGDSFLIRAPWDRHVLIDGGGVTGRAAASGYDIGQARIVPTLRRLGVRRLELVINTHPHADHVQGLATVVAEREVGRVFASWAESTSLSYRRFVEATEAKGLAVERFQVGDVIRLSPGVTAEILAAGSSSEWPGSQPSLNNRSIVLRLNGGHHQALFMGDAEEAAVRNVLAQSKNLTADVLHIPHHGGPLPSLPTLLAAVQPEVAFISVGAFNAYGHPAYETITALIDRNVKVVRTDRHGAINIQMKPTRLAVRHQLSFPPR